MAYTDAHRPPDARALAGATVLQIGIGALVITGLTNVDIPFVTPPKPNPTAVFEPLPLPPPPPEPQPTVEPRQQQPAAPDVSRPDPIVDYFEQPAKTPTSTEREPIDDFLPRSVPNGTPGGTGSAKPTPQPSFKPVGPVPASAPVSWFSTDDYPSYAIRRGLEGTVGYSLQIAANGRIESCTVTRSSGHSSLDRATCNLLPRRGKFEPARDASGAKAKGTFAAEIVWKLP